MLALSIELLAGRYHATPWDRAANEGEPEWPPSPWRIARALASAWWRTPPGERPDNHVVDSLFRALGGSPRFLLPKATTGHSRHYMLKPAGDKTTLVLDAFVRVGQVPIVVAWDDVVLAEDELAALKHLADRVGYLGRAESPCVLRVIDALPEKAAIRVEPVTEPVARGEPLRLLCVSDNATLVELSESTAERRKRRVVTPPGGAFVAYTRPIDALVAPRRVDHKIQARSVTALRFAVEGSAVPPLVEAIRFADRYRAAVLKRADVSPPDVIERLRGNAASGRIRGHQHAHYLPTDEDGDGRLDHLTVWCPAGIGAEELDALDFVRLASWAFDHPVQLVLLDTLAPMERSVPVLAEAQRWVSHTPFLPTRHPKRRGGRVIEGYAYQVATELGRRGFPSPTSIKPLRAAGGQSWGSFRRERGNRAHAGDGLPALGFEIEFDDPVRGPIALGRNSHFGMGLFLPAD